MRELGEMALDLLISCTRTFRDRLSLEAIPALPLGLGLVDNATIH